MIELADLVRDLRTELADAINSAPADGLRFRVESIELELTVTAARTEGSGAKLRFVVLDAGMEHNASRSTSQRITLTLAPEDDQADQPYVSGARAPHER